MHGFCGKAGHIRHPDRVHAVEGIARIGLVASRALSGGNIQYRPFAATGSPNFMLPCSGYATVCKFYYGRADVSLSVPASPLLLRLSKYDVSASVAAIPLRATGLGSKFDSNVRRLFVACLGQATPAIYCTR
jgi:hypothetical protein